MAVTLNTFGVSSGPQNGLKQDTVYYSSATLLYL